MNTPQKLFLWEGTALYIGPLTDVTEHRHHATQVCFGLDGPFRLHDGDAWQETRVAVLQPNRPHIVDSGEARLITALLDSESEQGCLGSGRIMPEIETMPELPQTCEEAKSFLVWLITPFSPHSHEKDWRIEKVLAHISSLETKQINAASISNIAGLSESRFLHLFKEQVGLPLRRFLLWGRIIDTVDAILAGNDLTTAAHVGGFSDSAHFSRTFRETFGLAPSEMFKNSRNIQVIT